MSRRGLKRIWPQICAEKTRRRASKRGFLHRRPTSLDGIGYNGDAPVELREAYAWAITEERVLSIFDMIPFFGVDLRLLDRSLALRNSARTERSTKRRRRLLFLADELLWAWVDLPPAPKGMKSPISESGWKDVCEIRHRARESETSSEEKDYFVTFKTPKNARERHQRRTYQRLLAIWTRHIPLAEWDAERRFLRRTRRDEPSHALEPKEPPS